MQCAGHRILVKFKGNDACVSRASNTPQHSVNYVKSLQNEKIVTIYILRI